MRGRKPPCYSVLLAVESAVVPCRSDESGASINRHQALCETRGSSAKCRTKSTFGSPPPPEYSSSLGDFRCFLAAIYVPSFPLFFCVLYTSSIHTKMESGYCNTVVVIIQTIQGGWPATRNFFVILARHVRPRPPARSPARLLSAG